MLTIGVSIGLPEPYATQIQDARRSFGDPLANAVMTHITLIPPMVVARAGLDEVRQHLRGVAALHAPYDVLLEGTGSFRPISPVVFVNVVRGFEECASLAAGLRSGPLERELNFPYHPHVTLAHHVPEDALDRAQVQLAEFRLAFRVGSFQLYEQGLDTVWQQIETFPLG